MRPVRSHLPASPAWRHTLTSTNIGNGVLASVTTRHSGTGGTLITTFVQQQLTLLDAATTALFGLHDAHQRAVHGVGDDQPVPTSRGRMDELWQLALAVGSWQTTTLSLDDRDVLAYRIAVGEGWAVVAIDDIAGAPVGVAGTGHESEPVALRSTSRQILQQ
jgi:hypothetical protein